MIDELPQSLQIFLVVMLIGGAVAWGAIELRIWRGKRVLDYESRRPVPWNWVDLLLTLLIYLGSQAICISFAVRWAGIEDGLTKIGESLPGQLALLASAAVSGILTFFCSIALLASRSGANSQDFGFVSKAVPRDALYGLVAFFAAAPIVYGIQCFFAFVVKIEYDHPLVRAIQKQSDPTTTAIVVFTAIVAAPLVEEYLFRVLLQGWLEKIEMRAVLRSLVEPDAELAGDSSATGATSQIPTIGLGGLPLGSIPILVSSLLFALVHFGQGAAPVPLFVYALMLGFLYQRTHRIMPSLAAHFALNSVSLAMLFLFPMPGAR